MWLLNGVPPIQQYPRQSNVHWITYLIVDFNQVDKVPKIWHLTAHKVKITAKSFSIFCDVHNLLVGQQGVGICEVRSSQQGTFRTNDENPTQTKQNPGRVWKVNEGSWGHPYLRTFSQMFGMGFGNIYLHIPLVHVDSFSLFVGRFINPHLGLNWHGKHLYILSLIIKYLMFEIKQGWN